ncbi:MAG: CcmD family protein [Bryobacterales bacterium]
MGENLKWLWAAFGIGWALHVLYVFLLASRQKSLRNEMRQLRAQLEERDHDGGEPLLG